MRRGRLIRHGRRRGWTLTNSSHSSASALPHYWHIFLGSSHTPPPTSSPPLHRSRPVPIFHRLHGRLDEGKRGKKKEELTTHVPAGITHFPYTKFSLRVRGFRALNPYPNLAASIIHAFKYGIFSSPASSTTLLFGNASTNSLCSRS